MQGGRFTKDEQCALLRLARQSVERAAAGLPPVKVDLEKLPPRLAEPGVSFVTLTLLNGELRGCIGALEITQPLALDVCEHAAAAAVDDYRFEPVRPAEVPCLRIEISVLSQPSPLECDDLADLPRLLRPGIDGVVLRDGPRRATFLPQVWEKLPEPCAFLDNLCLKLGGPADLWRRRKLRVETYQVEKILESLDARAD